MIRSLFLIVIFLLSTTALAQYKHSVKGEIIITGYITEPSCLEKKHKKNKKIMQHSAYDLFDDCSLISDGRVIPKVNITRYTPQAHEQHASYENPTKVGDKSKKSSTINKHLFEENLANNSNTINQAIPTKPAISEQNINKNKQHLIYIAEYK